MDALLLPRMAAFHSVWRKWNRQLSIGSCLAAMDGCLSYDLYIGSSAVSEALAWVGAVTSSTEKVIVQPAASLLRNPAHFKFICGKGVGFSAVLAANCAVAG